jgi:hypothetical protein
MSKKSEPGDLEDLDIMVADHRTMRRSGFAPFAKPQQSRQFGAVNMGNLREIQSDYRR